MFLFQGLLLSSIRSKDPVIFMEPKALYRASVEHVPSGDYEIPLGKAEILKEGNDVTIIGWGGQLQTLSKACDIAQSRHGINCELIDLQTLLPWDVATVEASVRKTGKLIVSHEAPKTCGLGAEIAACIQERCFLSLEAPIMRVCGYDIPFPLGKFGHCYYSVQPYHPLLSNILKFTRTTIFLMNGRIWMQSERSLTIHQFRIFFDIT